MSRRLVIPDIHGCSKTFRTLVEKVGLTREDSLYLLGDYIDRGPDSKGVIDYIIRLKENGYNIIALRGNHEEDFLNAYKSFNKETFEFYVNRFKTNDLLDKDGAIQSQYYGFLSELLDYVELPDFILIHAGINFAPDNPFEDRNALLVLRNTVYDAQKAKNRHIVFGHQPTYLSNIEDAINKRLPLIPLDNGCIYNSLHKVYDYRFLGHLLCLNLDNWELTKVQNCDT